MEMILLYSFTNFSNEETHTLLGFDKKVDLYKSYSECRVEKTIGRKMFISNNDK